MSSARSIVIFGSGPGIGNHVASEFASHGFDHVILAARNEARLQDDAAFVTKSNPNVKVDTLKLDLSNTSSLPAALKKIEDLAGTIGVVYFNAARIRMSEPLSTSSDEIEEDFKTTTLALYIVAQWAIPRMQALAKSNASFKPSLLVTNSFLSTNPMPQLLSLSVAKASQANMVQSFSRAFESSGVHVGLIYVNGPVTPEAKNLNPINIAQKAWGLFESGEGLDVHINE